MLKFKTKKLQNLFLEKNPAKRLDRLTYDFFSGALTGSTTGSGSGSIFISIIVSGD